VGAVEEFNECETLGLLRVVVVGAIDVAELAKLGEQILQLLWPDIRGDVPHKKRLAAVVTVAVAGGRRARSGTSSVLG